MQLQSKITCNLCGADDASTVFEAGVAQINRVVKCRQCGLMYSNPRLNPVDQEMVKDFDPEFTSQVEDHFPDRFRKETFQIRDYTKTREMLAELYPERGRLLEIGCGMGFLLRSFADDGWDVVGIEPDRGFCKFIAEEHKLEAIPAILEEAALPEASIDVVIFLHVIEHVPDPLRTLEAISRVLKPGGHLIVETPRYDSTMFRLLRHRERSVSCDGHIYFFTSETLRKLCQRAGFEQLRNDYVGRSLSLDRAVWNLGVMSKNEWVKSALHNLSRTFKLESRHAYINLHDMQRAVLRKPVAQAAREQLDAA